LIALADWRDERAESFPSDAARNSRAAQLHREISAKLVFNDYDWSALEPLFNGADQRLVRSLTHTNRQIGFKLFPKDSSQYVSFLIQTILSYNEKTGGFDRIIGANNSVAA
jgi:hypothetical protein